MRILKTVELTDFAEKSPTGINVLLLFKAQEKRIYKVSFVISNVIENFIIHGSMLSAIFRKSASFKSRRFPKPWMSTVFRRAQKNTSIISRKSIENRMNKRIGFYKNDLKLAKSTAFGRMAPTEWEPAWLVRSRVKRSMLLFRSLKKDQGCLRFHKRLF